MNKILIAFLFLTLNTFSQEFDQKTVSLIDDNKLSKASKRLEKINKKELDSVDYLFLKGKITRKKGDFEEANAILNKVVALDSNYAYAIDELAIIQTIKKNYTASLALSERALTLKPNDPIILGHRGSTYFVMEKYEMAKVDYLEALRIEPKNDYTIYNLGLCNLYLKNYDEAIKRFTQSLTLRKKEPKAYFDRARSYYNKELYDLALKDFKKALKYSKTENKFERLDRDMILKYINTCKHRINKN